MFMTSALIALSSAIATDMTMDSSQSASDIAFHQSIVMPGTLIGNWDEKSNPDGTMTRPGWSGGSGNMPVECQITPTLDGDVTGEPGGYMTIDLDLEGMLVSVEGLHADLLGEKVGTLPLSIGLLFETFRTFQPDSLYIGGAKIDIPLGEGRIISLDLDQSTPVDMVLIADGVGWTFAGAIPGMMTITVEIQETPMELPLPVVVPLQGSITIDGTQITMSIEIDFEEDETFEAPAGWGFENIPMEFPTVIPPGQTAYLLISAAAETVETSMDLDAAFVFRGEAGVDGDVNGDGFVNVADVLAVIAAWGKCDGSGACEGDLDGDGHVGVTDLLIVLENWD